MCTFIIIAARSQNGTIGNNNQLPWHLPSDLRSFRNLTTNKIVIMGRKTYESIGKPLPNRINLVITSNKDLKFPDGVIVASDAKEAVKKARIACIENNITEAWVIGGNTVYKAFMKRADKMLLSTISCNISGDVSFPTWRNDCWKKTKEEILFDPKAYIVGNDNEKGLQYTLEEYERIQ